jgi:hypothetical protein
VRQRATLRTARFVDMRQFVIAIIAALALSGCKTSGYNPLKIETEQGWQRCQG